MVTIKFHIIVETQGAVAVGSGAVLGVFLFIMLFPSQAGSESRNHVLRKMRS
jgi:hypothetical protein